MDRVIAAQVYMRICELGSLSAAARALGLDVANLHRLAKRLGLKGSRPDKNSAG